MSSATPCTCSAFNAPCCNARFARTGKRFCIAADNAEDSARWDAARAARPPQYSSFDAAQESLAAMRAAGDTRRLVACRASCYSGGSQNWIVSTR